MDQVCDVASALSQCARELFLRMSEPIHKLAVPSRLFDRVQIRALDVFDDRNFQDLKIIVVADHGRYFVNLSKLGGTPASFAGNNLKFLRFSWILTDDKRLDDPSSTDGFSQVFEIARIEPTPGLIRVRGYPIDRN